MPPTAIPSRESLRDLSNHPWTTIVDTAEKLIAKSSVEWIPFDSNLAILFAEVGNYLI